MTSVTESTTPLTDIRPETAVIFYVLTDYFISEPKSTVQHKSAVVCKSICVCVCVCELEWVRDATIDVCVREFTSVCEITGKVLTMKYSAAVCAVS